MIKDLVSIFFKYFLKYILVYVLFVIGLGLLPIPLYIKDVMMTLLLPVYGIVFVTRWMKRRNMDISCIKSHIQFNRAFLEDTAFVLGADLGLTILISLILNLFMSAEGNIDVLELHQNPLLYLLVYGVLSPIDEEFFFRAFLMNSLEKHGRIQAAVLISIVFGLAHFNLLVALSAFIMSMCVFALRFKYNSIWPCVLVHIGTNTLNQWSALDSSTFSIPNLITYGLMFYTLLYVLRRHQTLKTEFMKCFEVDSAVPAENEMYSE